ncbi:MAG: aminotransferase class V-fold PLP-dependent enzyme [Nanoarchaeota archaeon]|nr:aminotransferase class V-fold PLP-dependent enzyme [Nanoarchaeota archaeon]
MIWFKKKIDSKGNNNSHFSNNNLKPQFTIFEKQPNLQYFDSACVTLKPKQVVSKLQQYYEEYPACSGRSAHKLAQRVNNELDLSREKIKKFLNINSKTGEIVFTKNATEAINLISYALEEYLQEKCVVITDKEHNSNYLPWLRLQERGNVRVIVIKCEKYAQIEFNELEEVLKENNVGLVSMFHASNVDGSIMDMKKVVKLSHKYNSLVLSDSCQMSGHKKIDVKELGVDFLATSVHKMYGPSGVGLLYINKSHLDIMNPFIIGGDTVNDVHETSYELLDLPNRFEAGLQDYAGMISTGAAIDFLDKNLSLIEQNTKKCLEMFFDELEEYEKDGKIEILSSKNDNCGVFTFIPKTISSKELGVILSEQNICIRTGNFCVHNWFNTYKKDFAIRFSISAINTPEDVREVCKIVKNFL